MQIYDHCPSSSDTIDSPINEITVAFCDLAHTLKDIAGQFFGIGSSNHVYLYIWFLRQGSSEVMLQIFAVRYRPLKVFYSNIPGLLAAIAAGSYSVRAA
jgi:hypothetical protein